MLLIIAVAPDHFKGQPYQYVYKMRSDAKPSDQDWTKPLYEIMRSPSKELLPVTFFDVEWKYREEWDKNVKNGAMHKVDFPDGSFLYLSSALTTEDQTYVAKAFWEQRWKRWLAAMWPWIVGGLVPPVIFFIIGWVMLWVARGFKAAS